MKNTPPELTDGQIRFYEIVNKTRMAWVALIAALLFFGYTLAAFLRLLFLPDASEAKWIAGAIDAILGVCLRQVYVYLFPSPAKALAKGPSATES